MKLSATMPGTYSVKANSHIGQKPCAVSCVRYEKSPRFKGITSSLTGFCFGGLSGLAAAVGLSIIGVPINIYAALLLFGAGSYGGARGADKLEEKINKKLDIKS